MWLQYRSLAASRTWPRIEETGFRVFSQFDEDGKLLFAMAALGIRDGRFLDIGSGDGIRSNCANLALNFGWTGVYMDGDADSIRRGRTFYRTHADSWAHPPQFLFAMVTRENINQLIQSSGVGDVELMSIDIDGNDYWIWEAINCINPKVVVIEARIEFGSRSIVVPYDAGHAYPGPHPDYFGGSLTAMAKLANTKGYRLVGANSYGFNLIFVRQGCGEEALPEVTVDSVMRHPRNAARAAIFDRIKDLPYVEV